MNGELDLIRAFRAEDAVVDASSLESARAALLERIAGSTNSPPRKRWGWLRRRSRPVAVLLVALVIVGAGGAVVLSLNRSQPLAGRVPGAITPASLAGYGYTIAVVPPLAAGTTGWASLIVYSRPGTIGYVQSGGGAEYPTATFPVFGGGTDPDSCPVCFARGNAVTYVLTGPQVFAVRIGTRTIRTVTSRALPTGVRAAVVFIPAKGRAFLFPGGPVPVGKAPPGLENVLRVPVVPLDRSGRVITTQFTLGPPAPQALTWMAPDAVTRWWPLARLNIGVPYHQDGYPGRTHPGAGVCELAQHGLPALHAEFGHTIAAIPADADALGEVFVSCIDAEYYLHGWPLQAGVLLDGHRPGQGLGPIPGARPVPGHPDMVNLPLGRVPWNYDGSISAYSPQFSLTAKRVGNAWLVVQGGSGLAQRVQMLNALRISKLDLHHLTSEHAPH